MAEKENQSVMAEKEQQSAYPANGGDTEAAPSSAAHDARELRKKKRTKCFLYILLFVVFQTAIITVFALTVMKVKTPKFRIRSASLTVGNTTNQSLRGSLTPDFSVKNTNFGRYKYRNTTVEFFYGGAKIGEVFVPNSKAGWRSTKRFIPAAVDLNINGSPQLSTDLSAGVVPITSSARMTGRVELMFIMKKNKSTNMNCTMEIVVASQSIRNIVCR